MEFRRDKYTCDQIMKNNIGCKFADKSKKGGFLDGFKNGFYEACFIKNKEILDWQKRLQTQCEITKTRDEYLKEADKLVLELKRKIQQLENQK